MEGNDLIIKSTYIASRNTERNKIRRQAMSKYIFPNFRKPLSSERVHCKRYEQTICSSIIRLCRYEKSLLVWNTVLSRLNEDAKTMIIVNYINPLYNLVADLPSVIKNQIIRAAVSLVLLNRGSSVEIIQKTDQNDWIKRLDKISKENPHLEKSSIQIRKLRESTDARILQKRYGNNHHDTERSPIKSIPFAKYMDNGLEVIGFEPMLNLTEEINTVDRQRKEADKAFFLLVKYLKTISDKRTSSHQHSYSRSQTRFT